MKHHRKVNPSNLMRRMAFGVVVLLFTLSCDNVNTELDSVLNYPGAVVTHLSYEDCRENDILVTKYYMRLLRRSPHYSNTHYEYVDIRVSRYEFERYDVGDTIPGEVEQYNSNEE